MIAGGDLARALAALGEPLLIPQSEMLFDRGEPCTGAYVLEAGAVEIQLISPAGMSVWTRTLSAGAILGLAAAVSLREHHMRATAVADSRLVFLSAEKIRSLLENDLPLGLMIVELIGEQLNALEARLLAISGGTPSDQPRL